MILFKIHLKLKKVFSNVKFAEVDVYILTLVKIEVVMKVVRYIVSVLHVRYSGGSEVSLAILHVFYVCSVLLDYL